MRRTPIRSAKGYIFRESFIQHDNIEVLKTGRVAVFIGWYSQITIHFQRVLLAGAYPPGSATATRTASTAPTAW